MRGRIGLLFSVGFVGLLAAANAQTSSSASASTQLDGTYAFVSSAKVNETWMSWDSRMGRCQDLQTVRPLIIAKGQARLNDRLRSVEGTVGPRGDLVMRADKLATHGVAGYEQAVNGTIDASGTVRARQINILRS